ncbi:hypothetical protein ZYGR_0AV01450 [Zygosaccharomyces rouxii]|uniref:Regulator of Ty1 transposition protein 10 n=1 Tax=Zygosaccharomyces rouxii TaxID=4956 RepID=A0A1Q3AJ21_ZYGRO|nr:hypothetical protein ZYGR_0AV01450 [Zygosaccharomyces rouxii]
MDSISHYGPALSVKFFGRFVYAGYGPFLHVYEYATGKLINKCLIFNKNKVHGVRISENGLILCYGSRSVNLASIKDVQEKNCIVESEKHTSEWIISGEFNSNYNQFYLLTCYDRVLTCDLKCNIVKKSAVYGERSILYSGSIKVVSEDKVFINAGTVMGGIIVWELFSKTLVANLIGHSGSIFYVSMNKDGSLVASCSDDRSVRLWDLKSQRELSVGWAHTARIWNLLFYNDDTRLISVSEDCTCRVWDIQGAKLLQSAIYEVHLTKNVWCVDVSEEDQLAVTSGNDGRLRLISLAEHESLQKSFTLKEVSDDSKVPFAHQEIIKGFHWFSFGLVAITSEGNILQYGDHWKFLMQNPRFRSYSMTNGVSSDNIVVFSNNKCDLLILKFNTEGNEIVASRELHIDILTKSQNCMVCRHHDNNEFFVTLESPNPRDPFICLKFDTETLDLKGQFGFKKPDAFTSSCLEVYESSLLVGSRFSTIAIFDLDNTSQEPFVSRRLTPGDTTTSIHFVEFSVGGPVFVVTNRDGYYNFIRLKLGTPNEKLEVVHSNRTVRGFLEGAYYDKNGELITYGFKSELFYIYNETQCYEKAVKVCGGAHRQWKLARTSEGFMLVFIRASDIHFTRVIEQRVPEILQCGTHGREIRDIALLKDSKYKNGYLFCTASEDTTIKLCHLDENTGRVTTFWTLRKHVSGLQRCKFINNKLMISSSAREELFLWELTTDCNTKPYIKFRQALPISGNNPDLRITDFSVRFEGSNFILVTVYSDSAVKLWYYDHSQNRFRLTVDGYYKTCCILNAFLFAFKNQSYLMLSATDGHLSVYNLTNAVDEETICPLPSLESSVQVHQSSIKAMNISVEEQNDTVRVYTGGDDNALAICVFHWENQIKRLVPQVTDIQRSAASSTITSSELISHERQLVTASVDQIVRMWDTENDKFSLQHQKYTTVADTGSLDAVNNLLLIGGVGLSVWTTESH